MALNKQQWTLVSGLGVGAGLMYLLDPQAGGRRRALVRDKAVSAYTSGSDVVRKTSRDLGNRSKGLAAGVRSKLSQEDADDRILRERVRSKLGRWVSHPGAIEVSVEDRVVTLRGQVSESEVDRLLKKVRKAKGVEDVRCELIIGDSDAANASNSASSLQGDGEIEESARGWSRTTRLLAGTAGGALAVAALLGGRVNGSSLNPKRLLRRGRPSPLESDDLGRSLADSGGDGSAVRQDNLHSSDAERYDYEPVHTH
jgi:hypothetical protein